MILSILIATGCNVRDPSFALEPYKDCNALEKAVKGQAEEEIRWAYSWGGGGWGFGGSKDMALTTQESAPMAAEDGAGGMDTSNRSTSDTNTQVAGVDEADLVETDGTYIYALAGDSLVITQAWPAEEIDQVARLTIEGQADGMFLTDDDLLVVVSQLGWQDPDPLSGGDSTRIVGNSPATKTTLVDISDVTDPTIAREVYTQGTLYDSRLSDGRLYVVSYSTLGVNRNEWFDNKRDALEAVEASTLSDWLPGRFDNLRSGEAWASSDEDVSPCAKVYGSGRESGNYMVNVESLDLGDADSEFVGTSVLGSLDAIYANADSLYVVGSEAASGPWQSFDSTIETVVHRFDISGAPDRPQYVASGKVPGWVLNQFAMDEWDGHLRIATTAADPDGWDTSAGIYVLEESKGDLDVVGEVDGLAEGEQIFAVRFEEEVGYVVTFEQIDPLFTFDLSDHEAPQAIGELEITGFSNYIHPMGDGHLLAVGMEADEDGWQSNLQVSMFDVSDLADPQMTSRLQLSADYSESQNDHHAFNWYAPHSRLLLPAGGYSQDSEMVLIHAAAGEELEEVAAIDQDQVMYEAENTDTYCTAFRRSVIIEDMAYAISNAGVTVVDVIDGEAISYVAFDGVDPCANEYYYW